MSFIEDNFFVDVNSLGQWHIYSRGMFVDGTFDELWENLNKINVTLLNEGYFNTKEDAEKFLIDHVEPYLVMRKLITNELLY